MSQGNVEIVCAAIDAMNRQDIEAVLALMVLNPSTSTPRRLSSRA